MCGRSLGSRLLPDCWPKRALPSRRVGEAPGPPAHVAADSTRSIGARGFARTPSDRHRRNQRRARACCELALPAPPGPSVRQVISACRRSTGSTRSPGRVNLALAHSHAPRRHRRNQRSRDARRSLTTLDDDVENTARRCCSMMPGTSTMGLEHAVRRRCGSTRRLEHAVRRRCGSTMRLEHAVRQRCGSTMRQLR